MDEDGLEGRHQSTLPSVFDRDVKKLAARDPDVEAGASEKSGRLPDIGDAYAGQGDDDGAKVLSEEAAVSGGVADGDGESGSGATAVRLRPTGKLVISLKESAKTLVERTETEAW